MLKILWVIVATHNVNGFEVVKYTDLQYKTVGECATEILARDLDKIPNITHDCRATYNGKHYVSQPSWMSNEQAEAMVAKQEANREALKSRAK